VFGIVADITPSVSEIGFHYFKNLRREDVKGRFSSVILNGAFSQLVRYKPSPMGNCCLYYVSLVGLY
jgi:hypothetical protein